MRSPTASEKGSPISRSTKSISRKRSASTTRVNCSGHGMNGRLISSDAAIWKYEISSLSPGKSVAQ